LGGLVAVIIIAIRSGKDKTIKAPKKPV